MTDLSIYRALPSEQERIGDLLRLLPHHRQNALDVGARDGYLSRLLADRYPSVTALDLTCPEIDHPRIVCEAGNVASLTFPNASFDVVLCAEVLEHLAPDTLARACGELARVTRHELLIGVPYRQDIRLGRTKCAACGSENPPYGHQNAFDEERLTRLFRSLSPMTRSYVGETKDRTNPISVALMDFAGNPYGTYDQDEPCVHCGAQLTAPSGASGVQRVACAIGHRLRQLQTRVTAPRPKWIHMLFRRTEPDVKAT